MDQQKSVNINGRRYDAVTGLPVNDTASVQQPVAQPATRPDVRPIHAGNVHTLTQKSQTLRRSSLRKPVQTQQAVIAHTIQNHKKPIAVQPVVAKSPQIARFTPHSAPTSSQRMMDIAPVKHPVASKAQAVVEAKHTPLPEKTSQEIKQEVIKRAIDNTFKQTKPQKRAFRHPRVASIITASLALFILGGYLTYLNMPSLSVRVAAAAAGIDASYPNYRPDGYQLNGPVVYDKGNVSMKFAAAAGPQNFTIKQSKSGWDSAAVLDNYVTPKAGSDYATYTERGLTIYTFDGGVAWVNGGILYTIDGNAPLSSEQIRRLATSFI